MFETFNVPNVYVTTQAILSLHASNLTDGIVVDSGSGITNAVPVSHGNSLTIPISLRSSIYDNLKLFINKEKYYEMEFLSWIWLGMI